MTVGNDPYLKAIVEGDRNGLKQIYEEFSPSIIKLVRRNGGSLEDARDVFQSALIVIFQQSRQGELQLSGAFGGFLFAICRNIWGNRLQKKSFREVSIPEDAKYTLKAPVTAQIHEEEKKQLLRDKMKQLGADCQRLLTMFFAERSMEEIRQEMGYGSIGYATKRKFICKEKLIALIKKDRRYEELKW